MSNLFSANPYFTKSRAYFGQLGYESVTILVPHSPSGKVVTSIPVNSTEFKVIITVDNSQTDLLNCIQEVLARANASERKSHSSEDYDLPTLPMTIK